MWTQLLSLSPEPGLGVPPLGSGTPELTAIAVLGMLRYSPASPLPWAQFTSTECLSWPGPGLSPEGLVEAAARIQRS